MKNPQETKLLYVLQNSPEKQNEKTTPFIKSFPLEIKNDTEQSEELRPLVNQEAEMILQPLVTAN